jgi:hypothetical protein
MPDGYEQLENEPCFSAEKHLDLGQPESILTLSDLGYSQEISAACPSEFGICSAFKILSNEGLAAMRKICLAMYDNRNQATGTGKNRLGSYIRGAGYRSQFIKDFCDSPELAEHISRIAGVPLARHSVPAVACGVNYAPDDISKGVDSWHVDSVSYDIVMLLSDPKQFIGGEFQYFHGTKQEGQSLLGIRGEEGLDAELPEDRVVTASFPYGGYGFMQQGNMIFHRARRLAERAERMTMIPSFVVTPNSADDATNSINMSHWGDPGIVPELTRHEAWRAAARLEKLVDQIDVGQNSVELRAELDRALAPLLAFRNELDETEQ